MTADGRDAPAIGGLDLDAVKSDTVDFVTTAIPPTRAVYVGQDGHLKVTMSNGTTIVMESIVAGTLLPISIRRLWTNGTTALKVVGLY